MTMANNSINNRPIDDEAYEEAGVEITIPIDAAEPIDEDEAEETEESNDATTTANPFNSKRLIILWGLVIAAVGLVSYVASSSSASASSKMTNINQIQQQPKAIKKGGFKFDYVGDGWCVDDNPNDYDDPNLPHGNVYPFVGYRYQVDAKECGKVCAECPGEGQGGLVLRGFQIAIYPPTNPDYEVNSECFCLVDKSSIGTFESFEIIAYDVCGAPFSYGDAPVSVGTGEIVNSDNNPLQECWKVSSVSSKSSKTKSSKNSSAPSSKGSKSSSTPQRY